LVRRTLRSERFPDQAGLNFIDHSRPPAATSLNLSYAHERAAHSVNEIALRLSFENWRAANESFGSS
jgi:hypothetical protein